MKPSHYEAALAAIEGLEPAEAIWVLTNCLARVCVANNVPETFIETLFPLMLRGVAPHPTPADGEAYEELGEEDEPDEEETDA